MRQQAVLTSLEICAGAGGQALGLEQAGFRHLALVENDRDACATLRWNRPCWNVIEQSLQDFDARPWRGVDLLAGGLPCPPFSVAGQQLGHEDERNLFPEAFRLVSECEPRAVMIENVRGLMEARFASYREQITEQLERLGYRVHWALLNAADFGVSQLRPRVVIVGIRTDVSGVFCWPTPQNEPPPTVGERLYDLMASRGWQGVEAWSRQANTIAPTLVGGSKKHGGPDLGPTRAKRAWAALGINGHLIGNEPPGPDFDGLPTLTVPMVARLQGFPDNWCFAGAKTSTYCQVGNAFPPPVSRAVGLVLHRCLYQNSTGD